MHRVDYDRVAPLYDEPERDHAVDSNLLAFLGAGDVNAPSAVRILDIGCGTGTQLAANRRQFPEMAMAGVDRFEGMLRIAQRRCPSVSWLLADGARLPLASDAFHYATSQFAYPHFRNTGAFVTEVFRTLRPGGRFVMTNIDPWSMADWVLYRYFPEAAELDRQDFAQVDQFVALMLDAGFDGIQVTRDDRSKQENIRDFLDFASKRHRASQLMAISDDAYRAGVSSIERAVAAGKDQAIAIRSQFVLVTIAGTKPSHQLPVSR